MPTLLLINKRIVIQLKRRKPMNIKEKEIVTLKRSLLMDTEEKLNKQVEMEGKSSAYYLSMASWAEMQGFSNSAKFLYDHAEEERGHMLKLFRYINEAGGHAIQPEITDIRQHFNSLREVFELILEHEIEVTKSINNIVDHCFNVKDFATFSFMQWYVTEQREEETVARRALEIFDIIGEEGVGLWTIDQEMGKLHATNDSEV
ncbi:Ferritin Dps family protein [Cyclobacterium marinum DSM 745]|uniref:Ferritin n=2 Tax=Cyclobacterium marinum TaxID=104 RepID=G0J6Q4_CYCMS|nr:Ferritin Dps family protein [Cyclobacterium marinum DSM 745]|tara:strand:- start:79207 stop:79815 length:609 start_codon:yes stop_codon:yes gene_type:complete